MQNSSSSVFIIIPVYNRREITLKCLNILKGNGDLDKYHVVVVDDGSIDGTSQAIAEKYPQIIILQGDGNLWWAGAIRMGMEYACKKGAEYIIWLNDDCFPKQGTINTLLFLCNQNHNLMIGSQCIDPETTEPSYAGISTKRKFFKTLNCPPKSVIKCDALNGNLVCFHKKIVDKIGYPDSQKLPHHLADFVYTNNAFKKNFELVIHGDAISFCSKNPINVSWLYSKKSFKEHWQGLFLKKSPSYWKIQVTAYRLVFGNIGILYYFYHGFLKFLIIYFILRPLPVNIKRILKS
ncbi:glycosyltransferase family 2 protein [Synechocystis sp. PCC 7339]|uniref:glycosyltransferase family 2 protein n=1 Tax=unclassified Synechocystis TaxID=2640012 RepID=UPI001BAFE141|nr:MULTISPECIES: glycosyltransferase family 2 protein [unclassified Synechocystis]QUS59311.1 glycosyltransferase family 2 protein [Synechocystis sp. PCC 7338]UAJ71497.1 glycosyltransferase family 2 protein [Synechocystis sp. PCC 7339]